MHVGRFFGSAILSGGMFLILVPGCGSGEKHSLPPLPGEDWNGLLPETGVRVHVQVEGIPQPGQELPRTFSCDGEGRLPTISWEFASPSSPQIQEWIVIVYDPDAPGGTFFHLTVVGIPGEIRTLRNEDLSRNVRWTVLPNSAFEPGWYPVCPPEGDPRHRYVFLVLGLEERLPAIPSTPEELPAPLQNASIKAWGWTFGTYRR